MISDFKNNCFNDMKLIKKSEKIELKQENKQND